MASRRVVAWVVAALVTVALVAGGMLVARDGRSPAVLPALDLGETQAATAGAAAEPAPATQAGAEPARPDGTGDAPTPWPPVTYKLAGPLPALPDRARAWKVGDEPGAGRVAALAAALGLGGRTKEEPGGWTVVDGDRVLAVNRMAGAPFTYGTGPLGTCVAQAEGGPDRPGTGIRCLDPDSPVSNQPGAVAGGAGSSGAGAAGSGSASSPGNPGTGSVGKPGTGAQIEPMPPVTVAPVIPAKPVRPVDLPSPREAERVARDLAAKAGLDLNGATVRVTDAWTARQVSIAPAVGGLPTSGFAWSVTVGPKGRVQHAFGYLAVPAAADSYPLIGVAEGFERLARTPMIAPMARSDTPAIEPAIAPAPCPAGAKESCTAKRLPARVATVTGARLGLQLAPALPEGDRPADVAYLLPAYLFDLEGGWTDVRSVVAVPDRYLTR